MSHRPSDDDGNVYTPEELAAEREAVELARALGIPLARRGTPPLPRQRVTGPGGPMRCERCGVLVPDRFTGAAFLVFDADWQLMRVHFACAACLMPALLGATDAYRADPRDLTIVACGPVAYSNRTFRAWAEYQPPPG